MEAAPLFTQSVSGNAWKNKATNAVTFPPPLRFLIPVLLLLLLLGLLAAWMDYQLDLANDLTRNFNDVTTQAEATGARLTQLAQQHLVKGEIQALNDNLSDWKHEPWLRMAAVVDEKGRVLASSSSQWVGLSADETPAATAWKRASQNTGKIMESATLDDGDFIVLAAFPLEIPAQTRHWLLLVYDRANAVLHAHQDARRRMEWSASVIAIMCLGLWAILHFGVAARLERLARSVREFGEGRTISIDPVKGGDEVHELSQAFRKMTQRLADRERERTVLERAVIDTAENERRRIGHELHDGIGQQLTAVLMAINGLHDELQAKAPAFAEHAQHASRSLREALAEVRGLSHGLAPVPLWEQGLEHALQALADVTTRSSGVRCVFECPAHIMEISEATACNLYRIAQEAVNNALKHADSGEIRIGLECRDGFLVLEIDDDGCGLPEVPVDGGGIGFRIMQHRTEVMGGRMEHGAPPAGGTRIAVHIPNTP
ncbi:MAG: HAMP domain-containing protein [Prosthecobacter sp.]|uniref:sensor histidine kinase n=1 Tax=Prosthecobacter sp. TaxID=1965333 RepID=UPI0025DE6536|nr:ATP-binding protein [Prosthecobacter sp.]MCF7785731.1 HAMP domain-containing protein [Prosthecobacter sp.]